jgi:hypothetical protein
MASLAVRLDKKGCAVGAVTNGALTGAFSPVLPISRNAWHLARLLELLARIRLEATEDLAPLLSRASTGPWGTCCVHFALREGDEARLTESVLSLRKIPTLSVVSRKDPPSGSTLPPDYSRGIHLDALRRGGNGSP